MQDNRINQNIQDVRNLIPWLEFILISQNMDIKLTMISVFL